MSDKYPDDEWVDVSHKFLTPEAMTTPHQTPLTAAEAESVHELAMSLVVPAVVRKRIRALIASHAALQAEVDKAWEVADDYKRECERLRVFAQQCAGNKQRLREALEYCVTVMHGLGVSVSGLNKPMNALARKEE